MMIIFFCFSWESKLWKKNNKLKPSDLETIFLAEMVKKTLANNDHISPFLGVNVPSIGKAFFKTGKVSSTGRIYTSEYKGLHRQLFPTVPLKDFLLLVVGHSEIFDPGQLSPEFFPGRKILKIWEEYLPLKTRVTVLSEHWHRQLFALEPLKSFCCSLSATRQFLIPDSCRQDFRNSSPGTRSQTAAIVKHLFSKLQEKLTCWTEHIKAEQNCFYFWNFWSESGSFGF